jgi:hypothetical protein
MLAKIHQLLGRVVPQGMRCIQVISTLLLYIFKFAGFKDFWSPEN